MDPIELDAARRRKRRGRPLTPHGHLDQAALSILDARSIMQDAVRATAACYRAADDHLRAARAAYGEAA